MIKVQNKFFWAIAFVATSLNIRRLLSELYHLAKLNHWKLLKNCQNVVSHSLCSSMLFFFIKFNYSFSFKLLSLKHLLYFIKNLGAATVVNDFYSQYLTFESLKQVCGSYIWKSLTKTDWHYKYYLPLQVFSFILIWFFAMINCLFRFFYLWKIFA